MRSEKGERSCSTSLKGMARLVGPFPLGRSNSSALLRSRNRRNFSRWKYLESSTIVSGAMVRCFTNPMFRAKRSRDATKSELSQPISGVRKRMSFIEPLYNFCKANVFHVELTQAHCKRSTGVSTWLIIRLASSGISSGFGSIVTDMVNVVPSGFWEGRVLSSEESSWIAV